ncbi:hypothetical protein CDAR_306521 [Caerostris darwini]|uniref:Secreted protein n=1 Tax=Caerostris darwini TaxID=1538125 RepID=A0AAV4SWU7_9ARAC|nr:hypothetical protein CDAR_306521 [Caerostris darwini]
MSTQQTQTMIYWGIGTWRSILIIFMLVRFHCMFPYNSLSNSRVRSASSWKYFRPQQIICKPCSVEERSGDRATLSLCLFIDKREDIQ